jgi:hypothetical protein
MDVAEGDLLYNYNKSESACTNMGIIAIPSILEYDVPNFPFFRVGTKRKTNHESKN